ncbi:acyl-CoA Delta-9 desaturase-like, partial [Frankliniella occidentalis]|uniref:Acyl-CoA Delta-9 desaturase-like n=1 Tax=Frankliniella occidentalis TaxID=133901 RepID=A0A9C6XD78_FRAOC
CDRKNIYSEKINKSDIPENTLTNFSPHASVFRSIAARENVLVALGVGGEGYHNYHHVFPWDYKSGEFSYYASNYGAVFIELMARLGQASHLKSVNHDMVRARAQRTGDGSHPVWGWGDKDLRDEDKRVTVVN